MLLTRQHGHGSKKKMRGLHEIVPIGDVFCSGIGAIERLDGNMLRFWLYALQTPEDGGPQERIVVGKLVAPASAVPDAVLQMVAAVSDRAAALIPLVADMVN
jgi:hypothetical protein